jgi:hypothetical protein
MTETGLYYALHPNTLHPTPYTQILTLIFVYGTQRQNVCIQIYGLRLYGYTIHNGYTVPDTYICYEYTNPGYGYCTDIRSIHIVSRQVHTQCGSSRDMIYDSVRISRYDMTYIMCIISRYHIHDTCMMYGNRRQNMYTDLRICIRTSGTKCEWCLEKYSKSGQSSLFIPLHLPLTAHGATAQPVRLVRLQCLCLWVAKAVSRMGGLARTS